MGLYAPDPPAPPNPITAAGAQTSSNVSTALANAHLGNANVYGPNGSTTFTQSGNNQTVTGPDGQTFSIPQYNQTTTLSRDQQAIYDQQVRNQYSLGRIAGDQTSRIGSILGTPINGNSIPSLTSSVSTPGLVSSYNSGGSIQRDVNLNNRAPTSFGQTAGNVQYEVGADDFSADRQRVEDALFSRLEPRLQQDTSALDTRLRNQGLTPGSEAYNRAMTLNSQTGLDARMQAILAGGQEQSRLFDMDVQQGAFNNAAQQQDYDQLLGRGQFTQQGIGLNNAATLSMGQFHNAAQGQQNSQNAAAAAFGNAARQQGFANSLEQAGLRNQTSAQALQQMLALRQAPINEISALMSGSQVSQPTPASYRPSGIANTDVMGAIYNSAALANQNYAQQAANSNAMIGGIAGLGGSLITGGMAGGAGGFGSSLFGSLLKR
jgi:hypothetical protein